MCLTPVALDDWFLCFKFFPINFEVMYISSVIYFRQCRKGNLIYRIFRGGWDFGTG